ncbi:hypothetical protein PR048_013281 [Dryococelus australis]|uniref:Uncharacterized protein n=1 Tax=Dryococelus australis TaxID=614101 RepID=A0ABQ9HRW6_9NEOP|nr:hypothetical protein PR048_013281 [Dryococelus australis]
MKIFIQEIGKPITVILDTGTHFTSDVRQDGMKKPKVILTAAAVRHPRSNIVERRMKNASLPKRYVQEEILNLVEARFHLSAEMRKKHVKVSKVHEFNKGAMVLVKINPASSILNKITRMLCLLNEGPYEVISRVLKNCHDLRGPKSKDIVGIYN